MNEFSWIIGVVSTLVGLWFAHRKATVSTFLARVRRGDRPDPAALGRLPPRLRAETLATAIRFLRLDDRQAETGHLIDALARDDLEAAGIEAAEVALTGHHSEEMLALALRALSANPRSVRLRSTIADVHRRSNRPEEAVKLLDGAPADDLGLNLLNVKILAEMGRLQEADLLEAELSEPQSPLERARDLAASGQLDPDAWENFALLGAGQREEARGPAFPVRPLEHPRLALNRWMAIETGEGAFHAGVAELRSGASAQAASWFRRAGRMEPNFAVTLGLAAAMRGDVERHLSRAKDLPEIDGEDLADLFDDWPHLCEWEQRVLLASAGPLRAPLARLPLRFRVLPLEARPADLTPGAVVLCGVADTLDTCHWPAARQLATYAFDVLDDDDKIALTRLVDHGNAHPHLYGRFDLDEVDAFFASTYADWLTLRWFGLPRAEAAKPVWQTFEALFGATSREGCGAR